MKLLEDITCPGCKKEFTKETDLDKLDNAEPIKSNKSTLTGSQQILEKPIEKEPEIKIETVIEDFKPNYECPDGDCDIGVHKNKNYSKKAKGKCKNCDQFTKHAKGTCPWCKGTDLEELEEDELEELGITDPTEEHEGHSHE